MSEREDIMAREDIELLVNKFYNKVNADPLIGPVFHHVDWEKHLPTMYQFWASMILGEQTYRGYPFQKHMNLPIEGKHFERWLSLFMETVDENFAGERAEEIKMRAGNIASVFRHRLNV